MNQFREPVSISSMVVCGRKRKRMFNDERQGSLSAISSILSMLVLITAALTTPKWVTAFTSPFVPYHQSHVSSSLLTTQLNENVDTSIDSRRIKSTQITKSVLPSRKNPVLTSSRSRRSQLSRSNQHRLSAEQQQELFRHIMEVRRIRQMEIVMLENEYRSMSMQHDPIMKETMASPRTKVSKLELAKNTGYGSNVNELETALILGQQSREKIITANMGLVHYCVRDILKYRTLRSITNDDLIQEGAIGLSRAVDKYNPTFSMSSSHDYKTGSTAITTTTTTSNGSLSKPNPVVFTTGTTKFSTYAVYWIRAAILRSISERDDIMRVPEHVTTAIRKISNVAHAYGLPLEKVEDDDYQTSTSSIPSNAISKDMVRKIITDETGYSDQLIANAMKVRNRRNKYGSTVLSYESWMQQGKHYETDSMIQPSNVEESTMIGGSGVPNIEHMRNTLSRFLRPKEMEALSWRYGLNDNSANTEKSNKNSNPLAKRNYVMEAEMELFGSTTMSDGSATSTKVVDDMTIVKGKWGEAMSFNEVGKQMQVSAEYGRRLCHAALEKLRRAVDDGKLEPALLF